MKTWYQSKKFYLTAWTVLLLPVMRALDYIDVTTFQTMFLYALGIFASSDVITSVANATKHEKPN